MESLSYEWILQEWLIPGPCRQGSWCATATGEHLDRVSRHLVELEVAPDVIGHVGAALGPTRGAVVTRG